MIRACESDRAGIEACLWPHAHQAMFPLNNLARHGMAGGSDFAVTCWLTRKGGVVTDVLTLTDGGMVLPFLPSGDYPAAAEALRGRSVSGLVGGRDWVRGLWPLLALSGRPSLDADEGHFLLETSALRLPDGPGRLRPLAEAPQAVIRAWMAAYLVEALQTPAEQVAERVDRAYEAYLQAGSHVALMEGETPLAMTGFNAQIPGMVQVGGVYVPPGLRGRGLAGRAVALHLAASGAERATLFSASAAAVRAYARIGFRPVGEWSLILLPDTEVVHG